LYFLHLVVAEQHLFLLRCGPREDTFFPLHVKLGYLGGGVSPVLLEQLGHLRRLRRQLRRGRSSDHREQPRLHPQGVQQVLLHHLGQLVEFPQR
jgi:hypothetical protein